MDEMNQPVPPVGPPVAPESRPADYIQPAFWAGVCSGVLTGVPVLSAGCCFWMAGGGTLAVYFFQLMNGFPLQRPADGARLGMITGLFAFLIWGVVSFGSNVLISRGFWNFVNTFNEQFQKSMPTDPQTREFVAWASTTDGMITMFMFVGLSFLTAHVLLGALGGATGVRSFNKQRQ
jgi:hypothetical protein